MKDLKRTGRWYPDHRDWWERIGVGSTGYQDNKNDGRLIAN